MRYVFLLLAATLMLSACDNSQQNAQNAKDKAAAALDKATDVAKEQTSKAMDKVNSAMNDDNDADQAAAGSTSQASAEDAPQAAIAVLHPTAGNKDKGKVTFTPTGDGLKVTATMTGLTPGKHGFHIHLYGDCSAPDGTSAGTHFNLQGSSKNPPADIDRITGNLGNLIADDNGNAEAQTVLKNASLSGPKSIIGRAVVVHAKANDPSQPPIGAAGARQACGVIGIAEAAQRP